LPVFTRPRGSRNATFASAEVALNSFKVSAKDSAFLPLNVGTATDPESLCGPEDVVAAGLKSPVHSFGVVQAFGGGRATGTSSVEVWSEAELLGLFSACSILVAGVSCCCGSSVIFSGTGFGLSRGRDLGMAGIIGTAGMVDLCGAFGAPGVILPFARIG
jgi:hypothetical protein